MVYKTSHHVDSYFAYILTLVAMVVWHLTDQVSNIALSIKQCTPFTLSLTQAILITCSVCVRKLLLITVLSFFYLSDLLPTQSYHS